MAFDFELFKVKFTEEFIEEMSEIYDYISNTLKNKTAANRLFSNMQQKILNLARAPNLYMKINKADKLKNTYRRLVIKNYVVLYTVDYTNKLVFVSHIIYGKRNYLN